MTWHAPSDTLARYAAEPAAVDDVTAASVEAHLLACDACRAVVARATPAVELTASWDAVADRIDRPRGSMLERGLLRLGLPDADVRLVAATRGLQAGWVVAMVGVVAGVVAIVRQTGRPGLFLALAPLAPLAAVAAAFAASAEPAGEVAAATPASGAALVLRRSIAVLIVAFATLVAGAVASGGPVLDHAGWVLPALALAALATGGATYVRVEVSAVALCLLWLSLVSAARIDRFEVPTGDLAPFTPAGQLVALVVLGLAAAVTFARRDRLSWRYLQ